MPLKSLPAETPRGTRWVIHITGALLAAAFAPLIFMSLDREPPFTRIHGSLIPDQVEPGGFVAVRFITTKRSRDNCPGTVQQEIVDSQNTIYSKLVREAGPAKWEQDPGDIHQEIFYGYPVAVPVQAAPGKALFRTVTFRYCNSLQRWMHWPIIQIGPDLWFTITDTGRRAPAGAKQ